MPEVTTDDGEEFLPGIKSRDDAVKALAAAEEVKKQLKELQDERHRLLEEALVRGDDGFGRMKPPEAKPAPTLTLPDPLEDRVAFAKALMEQVREEQNTNLTAAEAKKADEARRIAAADAYLAAFNERHEDLAPEEMLVFVEKAFQELGADYSKRGLDIAAAMRKAPELIMDKVAASARKKVEAVKRKMGVSDEAEVAGVGGGSAPLNAPSTKAPPAKSFVDEFKEMQRKAGISNAPAGW